MSKKVSKLATIFLAATALLGVACGGSQPKTPDKPVSLRVSAGDQSADLSWLPPSAVGSTPIQKYRVLVIPTGFVVHTPGPDNTVVVPNLTNGRRYRFQVAAINDSGPGLYSDESDTITPTAP